MLINLAYTSIILCLLCGLWILADVIKHPQQMFIMNIVWPVTALYAGPMAVWAYYALGRNKAMSGPLWQSVIKGTLHCGSGCTLGDILSAILLLLVPISVFGSKLATDWLVEYIFAFLLGIIFQYYAIKPMRQLSAAQALIASLKADALSLTFWQIGMYGWMAISNFIIFHRQLNAAQPEFWLMMQIGMLCGLLTALPVNWWLIKKGIKEAM